VGGAHPGRRAVTPGAAHPAAARPHAALHRHGNRELSWLDFDHRVLELASDRRVPLLERVKLCAIAAANLDEFFAVRVSRLERLRRLDGRRSPDGRTRAIVLKE